MSFETWKESLLKDVFEINPKETLPKNTTARKISMDKISPFTRFITSFDVEQYKGGSKFRNGDTLLARITPCLENGKTAQVKFLNDDEVAFGSTEFVVLRGKPNVSDSDFVYYYSISPYFRERAIKSMVGTSGRQRVQINEIENTVISLPPLNEQIGIAAVLSSLDNRIEINSKINKKLELLAQTIFKNWFIDFEPFKDLDFVDSEIGKLPIGWTVGNLGESNLTSLVKPGIESFDGEKKYLATADVSETQINFNSTNISFYSRPSRANMQPLPKTVWFAKMKDSRKLIMIDDFSDLILSSYIFSTGFAGIKCTNESLYYIWLYISSLQFDQVKNSLCNGTTMEAINNENISNIKIAIPDVETLVKFNEICKPIFKKIYLNSIQNIKISNLRDLLLPKLMSGEIRVPKEEV
ncbi:MAG: restriction endonuclease subunit S [Erysipelotrichia bacterium]|jgi:type I restriction enzyme S subunit|nr:restriction endonuclease subunit S [Erysipelotrichia bacterium]